MRIFLRLLLIGPALFLAVAAGAAKITAKYLGPGHQPAADLPLLYRITGWGGELESEFDVRTDKDGFITLRYDTVEGINFDGYQIITGPDGTLHLRTREAWYRNYTSSVEAKFTFTIHGTVADADGMPVPGARVVLGGMILHRLRRDELMESNRPSARIATPALVVTTDENGAFSFPTMTSTRRATNPFTAAYLYARKEQGETVLAGEARVALTWRQSAQRQEFLEAEPARITMAPAETIRGTVVNSVTGEPVAGAAVCLVTPGYTSGNNANPAVQTNEKGEYILTGVLPDEKRLLLARKKGFGDGWADAAVTTDIILPPLVKVSGYIVDLRTAAPPPVRTRLMFFIGQEFVGRMTALGMRREYAEMNLQDGTFTVMLPVGPVSFLIYPNSSAIEQADGLPPLEEGTVLPDYRRYYCSGTIPPEGLEDIQLNVKRLPYYHIYVDAGQEGTGDCEIYFRKEGAEHFGSSNIEITDGWWWWPAQTGWGETMEVKVMRFDGTKPVDASPVYTIAASPDEGPFVIVVKPAGE